MTMNSHGRLVLGAALAGGLLVGRIVSADEGEQLPPPMGSLIETYSGTVISQVVMPGIVTPGGVRFTSTDRYGSISFEPGPAIFKGQPIDFSGHEPAFIASQMHWQWEVASGPTPVVVARMVECSGDGAAAGAINGAVTEHESGTPIMPGFSANNLAVGTGVVINAYGRSVNVHSPELPQLNGATVETLTSGKVDQVDAGTGLLMASFQGQIFATAAVAVPPATPGLPNVALVLLALGLIALGARQILSEKSRKLVA